MKTFESAKEEIVNERELSKLQKAYQKFFKEKLEDYDVKSPAALDKENMSKFFSEIKTEWPKEKAKIN